MQYINCKYYNIHINISESVLRFIFYHHSSYMFMKEYSCNLHVVIVIVVSLKRILCSYAVNLDFRAI